LKTVSFKGIQLAEEIILFCAESDFLDALLIILWNFLKQLHPSPKVSWSLSPTLYCIIVRSVSFNEGEGNQINTEDSIVVAKKYSGMNCLSNYTAFAPQTKLVCYKKFDLPIVRIRNL